MLAAWAELRVPSDELFQGLGDRPRPWSGVFVSATVHLVVVGLAWGLAGEIREAEQREARDRSAVEEVARRKERKWVVWYPQAKALPEVSPAKPFGPARTPQGEKSPETLVAQADRPESRRQFVYRPDRPERLRADVEAANLVAAPEETWRQVQPQLPQVEKAPRVRRRFEGVGGAPARGEAAPVAVSDELLRAAEGVKATAVPESRVGRVEKARRQFDSRSLEGARPRGVQAGSIDVAEDVLKAAEGVRNQGAEAKGLASLQAGKVSKPAARKFEGLPAGRPGSGSGSGSTAAGMVEAPEVGPQAVAVVGLNPGPRLVTPEGSRAGQFARAPVEGEASSGAGGGGVKVPGLMAKGAPGAAGTGAPANSTAVAAAVPDRRKMQELAVPPVARTLSAPLRAGARVVPALVEGVFSGRSVYTLVVPDVRVAGYQGDWVIWFGGRELGEGRMGAPYPSAKALVEGAAASPDGRPAFVQFAAVIGQDGKLSRVRVLKTRADDAVKTRALLELQTWMFRPATLNGQPVEVDAVIEVTFVF